MKIESVDFFYLSMPEVRDMIQRAVDAVEMYLTEGAEPAMNRFNVQAEDER